MTAPPKVSEAGPPRALGTEIIDSIDLPIMIVGRDCTVRQLQSGCGNTLFSHPG
jgi:hypothetical protein